MADTHHSVDVIQQQFASAKARALRAVADEHQEEREEMTLVLDAFNREITSIYDQLVQQPEQDVNAFILNCERIIDQDLTELSEYIDDVYDEAEYEEKERLLIPTQVSTSQDKVLRLNLAGFYKVLIRWARARL